MHVNKIKINKLLNLSSKLVPAIALSLVTIVLVGGKVSAASVTKSFVPYDMSTGYTNFNISGSFINCPASGELNTGQLSSSDIISPPSEAPFCLTGYSNNNTFEQHAGSIGIYRIDNPCTITPVDITVNAAATALKDTNNGNYAHSVGIDVGVGNFDSMDTSSASGPWSGLYDFIGNAIGWSPNVNHGLLYNNGDSSVPRSDSVTLNATGITDPRIGIGISDYTQNILGPYRIDSLTYTLTYPDGMADCTYQNKPPVVSPSTGSTKPSSPIGTVVITGDSIGASDPDNDSLKYSITEGNGSNYFTIDPATGDISTTQTGIPVGTYTLTVQVDDGKGGLATETVTITVSEETTVTTTSKTSTGTTNKEASLNDNKVLAKTGSSLNLILTLSPVATLSGLGLRKLTKNN